MGFVLGLILGLAVGYAAHYMQVTPGKIDELRELFKKK